MTLKIENNGCTNKKCNNSNYNIKLNMFEAIDASNQILVGLFGIDQ